MYWVKSCVNTNFSLSSEEFHQIKNIKYDKNYIDTIDKNGVKEFRVKKYHTLTVNLVSFREST